MMIIIIFMMMTCIPKKCNTTDFCNFINKTRSNTKKLDQLFYPLNQLVQRLPILLAQVQVGNTSENPSKKIRKTVYL